MPLEEWTCDVCGDAIVGADRGLVVWRTRREDLSSYDFKIVHKTFSNQPNPKHCDPGAASGFTSSLDIAEFLGDGGQAMLLAMLSVGPLKGGGGCEIHPEDMDDFVDLFRRVQTPFYEEARPHFRDEQTEFWLGDANEYYPYMPEVLERIAGETLGS